jgi:hypothetical protein
MNRAFSREADPLRVKKMRQGKSWRADRARALEHVPEKWTRFSDKDMLPKFLNWREFFPIR